MTNDVGLITLAGKIVKHWPYVLYGGLVLNIYTYANITRRAYKMIWQRYGGHVFFNMYTPYISKQKKKL